MTARFAALRDGLSVGAVPQAAPLAQSPVAANPTANPRVRGFSVGDGVYARGFQRFALDHSGNRQRELAGQGAALSGWGRGLGGFDSIISRNESTVNDVARTGVLAGLLFCAFIPDSCKRQPK